MLIAYVEISPPVEQQVHAADAVELRRQVQRDRVDAVALAAEVVPEVRVGAVVVTVGELGESNDHLEFLARGLAAVGWTGTMPPRAAAEP